MFQSVRCLHSHLESHICIAIRHIKSSEVPLYVISSVPVVNHTCPKFDFKWTVGVKNLEASLLTIFMLSNKLKDYFLLHKLSQFFNPLGPSTSFTALRVKPKMCSLQKIDILPTELHLTTVGKSRGRHNTTFTQLKHRARKHRNT